MYCIRAIVRFMLGDKNKVRLWWTLFLYNYVLLQQLQNDETKERVLLFQATADATRATKLNPQHVCALILRGWFENSEKVRKRFWPVLLAQANFDWGGGPQPRRGGGGAGTMPLQKIIIFAKPRQCCLFCYRRKNLTPCKSANKPSTICVRTACPKLSTSLKQAVNNL
jgi:hypothetical protein